MRKPTAPYAGTSGVNYESVHRTHRSGQKHQRIRSVWNLAVGNGQGFAEVLLVFQRGRRHDQQLRYVPDDQQLRILDVNNVTAFHQLGRFVFLFQHIESALTELLVLMASADDEAIRILINELEFSQRVKTTDVMFSWFVDVRRLPNNTCKQDFRKLMGEIIKLSEIRNHLVHSKYSLWTNVDGVSGLIREKSALRASKGKREDSEEELLPEAFEGDCGRLSMALQSLEQFRLRIIDWLYPVESA